MKKRKKRNILYMAEHTIEAFAVFNIIYADFN